MQFSMYIIPRSFSHPYSSRRGRWAQKVNRWAAEPTDQDTGSGGVEEKGDIMLGSRLRSRSPHQTRRSTDRLGSASLKNDQRRMEWAG